ncbi:MAG: hypothetical protein V4694_05260 [Pseudomonadota bacterium]
MQQKNLILIAVNFQRFVALAFLCLLFNCKSDPYLYDKAGFDSGARPAVEKPNPSAPAHIAPDYYYRQPPAYSAPQGYAPQASYQPQQPAPYYPPQQQYQAPAPYYQPPQQYQQQPYYTPQGGSRFYSNPYAIPPANYYPNYDADQYYVPPAYIQNTEPVQQAPDRPKY